MQKNDFGKDFFKLMNNAVFWKTMENVRKHEDIKFVAAERRRNCLVSEQNFHNKKFSQKNYQKILMNKHVYLWLSILELSKILIYEFWADYVKPWWKSKVFLLSKHIFFNWDSLHARLNSHYEAWSYKKRIAKNITGYRKSV